MSLQQALTTFRAIRRRYATGREAHPEVRFFSVQLALGSADMFWLTAAIEALEKAVAAGASEPDEAAVQGRPTSPIKDIGALCPERVTTPRHGFLHRLVDNATERITLGHPRRRAAGNSGPPS